MKGEEKRSERPWGAWELIFAGEGFKVKRLIVSPGHRLSLQSHDKRYEHWTVVKGVATVVIGDKTEDVHYNQSRYIDKKQKHRIENHTKEDVEIIEVQCGEYLGEDDITRYSDDYNRK